MALGIRERATLIALMALNREISNTELADRYRLGLDRRKRERLNGDGLIVSSKVGRGYSHRLTERGWKWVEQELTAPVPPWSGSAGGGLYALLHGLHTAVGSRTGTLRSLFEGAKTSDPQPASGLRERIRDAYKRIVRKPGAWVQLRDLRPLLPDVPKAELDEVLKHMLKEREANLTLNEDQGALTPADHAAAIRVGIANLHMISIR